MPTLNRAAYLTEAIESLLAQSCTDWQLLIADDASNDDTPEVAEGYARRDSRIRYVRRTARLGLIANWNHGFGATSGRYFAVLHDDDLWDREFLSATTEVLDSIPEVAFVSTDHDVIDATGQLREHQSDAVAEAFGRKSMPGGVVSDTLRRALDEQAFAIGATVFRRTPLESLGFLRPEARAVADFDLFLRLASSGSAGYYLPRRLMHYRVHAAQVTSTAGVEKPLGMLAVLGPLRFEDAVLERVRKRKMRRAVYNVGRSYLESGNTSEARPYLMRTLADPAFAGRAAVALALILLPAPSRQRVLATYRRFTSREAPD